MPVRGCRVPVLPRRHVLIATSTVETGSDFPAFMRPRELAALLHLKEKTLAEWRVTGVGPAHIKCGPRLCLYAGSSVREWLAKGQRTSTAAA